MAEHSSAIDNLKPLAELCLPDERWGFFRATNLQTGAQMRYLADHRHQVLSSIRLHAGVPEAVQQSFNTARNLSLYAWFVYRFVPVAELHAFSTAEMALRERAKAEGMECFVDKKNKAHRRKFHDLLGLAVNLGWIIPEGFHAVRMQVAFEDESEPKELPDCSTEPVANYFAELVKAIPAIRNQLAHGSAQVQPDNFFSLQVCADLINQLFAEPS